MDAVRWRWFAPFALGVNLWISSTAHPQELADELGRSEPPVELSSDSTALAAPIRIDSAADSPPAEGAAAAIEATEFDGVLPGVSTIDTVQQAWGPPAATEGEADSLQCTFHRAPFEQVVVTFRRGTVASVTVKLAEQPLLAAVAEQLELSHLDAVQVADPGSGWVGQTYPERGVTLRFAVPDESPAHGAQRRVAEIALEPIGARQFVLRAEAYLSSDYGRCLQDLARALELEPRSDRAQWLRSRALADLGRHEEALAAADEALRLEPAHPQYRLARARALAAAADYDQAVAETKQAVGQSASRPEVQAQCLAQLGDLAAAGPDRDYKGAVEYYLQAARLAEPLTGDQRPAVRRLAQETLIDTYLATASSIAWGAWKRKELAVPDWLKRAESLAEQALADEGVSPDYELQVYARALGCSVGMHGRLDPGPWAERALEAGRARIETVTDPLYRQRLEWELGLALYDALQAFHMRNELEPALEYGGLAAGYLEQGRAIRQEAPGDAYLLGRLYFRLGSIHAVGHESHEQAIAWYEKAIPLLERPVPASALADVGRQGESLVTLAVSYWTEGDEQKAVQLTSHGLTLMEQAVEEGVLDQQSLAVPCANLATMHEHLGDRAQAEAYAQRARQLDEAPHEQHEQVESAAGDQR